MLEDHLELPSNIQSYINDFDSDLTEEEFASPQYAYRILFVPKTANRKDQADRVIEFVKSDSQMAEALKKEYAVYKEMEKPKYLPGQIVAKMTAEGFPNFSIHYHTLLWKRLDAKNEGKGYGIRVAGIHWHWYERWVDVVRKHCQENSAKYA